MIKQIELESSGSQLTVSQLVDAVRRDHEILLTSSGRPVARVLAADEHDDRFSVGSAPRTGYWMADDFNDELDPLEVT